MADVVEVMACPVCGAEATFAHDHRYDQSGLDDGPLIKTPSKPTKRKTARAMKEIRRKAWETRRGKYGEAGHNGRYARQSNNR